MATYKFKYGAVETGYLIVASAKFTETTTSISKMVFVLQSNLTTFVLDDIVEFYDSTTTFKFKGTISSIGNNLGIYTIEVKNLGNQLIKERFSLVYRNKSPEFIIEDIITTQTTLTYSSTLVSGVTISKQVFNDELGLDAINKMMEVFNGAFTIDKLGVFKLVKKQDSSSSLSIASGTDILQQTWKTDANKKYTKIIVIGSNITQGTTETLTGTGTVFNTTFIPDSLEITGLTQTTDNIAGDYTVDAQNKQITFNVSQTNPIVKYTYQSQIKVEIGSGATLKLQKSYLESTAECLSLALSALNLYQNGIQTSKWLKTGVSDFENVFVGEKISVLDSNNNISGDFQVQRVDYVYPNKLYITVGEAVDSLFDWQKETQQRIQELEKKNQNSTFITRFNYNNNKILIRVTSAVTKLQSVNKGNAWVLDDVVNSELDSTFKLDGGTITNLV